MRIHLEFVVRDLPGRDSQVREDLRAGLDHHGWPAEVIFRRPGVRVPAQVFSGHDLVDEAQVAAPIVLRQRRREGYVEGEVRVLMGEAAEIVLVEYLLPRARAIPEAHLSRGVLGFEKMGELRAKRGHACAAAYEDHLALGRLDVEVAEGPDGRHRIPRLEVERVGRANAGRAILARGRGGDANVESQVALELLVACDGVIVAVAGFRIPGDQVKNVLVFPDGRVGRGDVEFAEADRLVGGDVELEVIARGENDLFGGVLVLED